MKKTVEIPALTPFLPPGVSRSWDDANRIVSLCNIYSKIKYEYDGAGQVRSETNTIAGSGGPVTTSYSRYPNGAVSRIIYPSTLSVRRDYNSRGQLSATGWSGPNNEWQATMATYHYRGDGKLDYQDYVNGVHTAFGYNDRGLVGQETISYGGQIYSQRTVYRDDRDRITVLRKSNNTVANPMENGRGDRFRYDEEGQLLEAWYNAADPVTSTAGYSRLDSFNYDALGNRRSWELLASKGWLNFTRKDNGLNQYHAWGSNPASYDDDIGGLWGEPHRANGVLMQDGHVTAGYNALNQPIMITTGAMGSNWMFFGYDPLGRCVKRWTGTLDMSASFPWTPAPWSNPASYFYYDGSNLIQEGTSASAMTRVYMLGNRVDDIIADFTMADNQWKYHHADPRGHAAMLTDSNGNLIEQYEYDAFGYPHCFSASNGWSQDVPYSSFGNRFLFTGREWLSELKLYDYRARMYQPELGRFLQPDPKEFDAGDYNLYRYCHNDPVNNSDPTGLFAAITEGALKENWIVGLVTQDAIDQRNAVNGTQQFYNAVNKLTNTKRKDGKNVRAEEVGEKAVLDAKKSAELTDDNKRLGHGAASGDEYTFAEYVNGKSLDRKGPKPGRNTNEGPEGLLPGYRKDGPMPLTVSHAHPPQGGRLGYNFQRDDIPLADRYNYISAVGWYKNRGEIINLYVPGGGFFNSRDGETFLPGLYKP